jgi:hypothetical protein
VLDTLNPQRAYLLTCELMKRNLEPHSRSYSPQDISKNESIFRPLWLNAKGPQLGTSVRVVLSSLNYLHTRGNYHADGQVQSSKDKKKDEDLAKLKSISWNDLEKCWEGEPFVIGFDRLGRVLIGLEEGADERAQVKAYFIASYIHLTYAKKGKLDVLEYESTWELVYDTLKSVGVVVVDMLLRNIFLSMPMSANPCVVPVEDLHEMYHSLITLHAKEALRWYSQDFHGDDAIFRDVNTPRLPSSPRTPVDNATSNVPSTSNTVPHSSTDAHHVAFNSINISETNHARAVTAEASSKLTSTSTSATTQTKATAAPLRPDATSTKVTTTVTDETTRKLPEKGATGEKSFFAAALDGINEMITPMTPTFSAIDILGGLVDQSNGDKTKEDVTSRGVVPFLTDFGWDLNPGRSRLGAGPWRFLGSKKKEE